MDAFQRGFFKAASQAGLTTQEAELVYKEAAKKKWWYSMAAEKNPANVTHMSGGPKAAKGKLM